MTAEDAKELAAAFRESADDSGASQSGKEVSHMIARALERYAKNRHGDVKAAKP